MNNDINFQFGMYNSATDSIIVNTGKNSSLVIRCKECNSKVILITCIFLQYCSILQPQFHIFRTISLLFFHMHYPYMNTTVAPDSSHTIYP